MVVLRDVKPFDDKQWDQLQESMKKGASKEQSKKIRDARQRAKQIKKVNF